MKIRVSASTATVRRRNSQRHASTSRICKLVVRRGPYWVNYGELVERALTATARESRRMNFHGSPLRAKVERGCGKILRKGVALGQRSPFERGGVEDSGMMSECSKIDPA